MIPKKDMRGVNRWGWRNCRIDGQRPCVERLEIRTNRPGDYPWKWLKERAVLTGKFQNFDWHCLKHRRIDWSDDLWKCCNWRIWVEATVRVRGCEFEFEMDEPAESGKSIESFDKGKTSLMRSGAEWTSLSRNREVRWSRPDDDHENVEMSVQDKPVIRGWSEKLRPQHEPSQCERNVFRCQRVPNDAVTCEKWENTESRFVWRSLIESELRVMCRLTESSCDDWPDWSEPLTLSIFGGWKWSIIPNWSNDWPGSYLSELKGAVRAPTEVKKSGEPCRKIKFSEPLSWGEIESVPHGGKVWLKSEWGCDKAVRCEFEKWECRDWRERLKEINQRV